MDDIKDYPTYWFLKEIEDFRDANPYPSIKDPLYDKKCSSTRFSPLRSSITPMAAAPARPGPLPRTCQTAPFKR